MICIVFVYTDKILQTNKVPESRHQIQCQWPVQECSQYVDSSAGLGCIAPEANPKPPVLLTSVDWVHVPGAFWIWRLHGGMTAEWRLSVMQLSLAGFVLVGMGTPCFKFLFPLTTTSRCTKMTFYYRIDTINTYQYYLQISAIVL